MQFSSRAVSFSIFLACVASVIAAPSQAAVPLSSSIEGVLYGNGGGPAADGLYNVVFALYKDENGGNPLWSEGPVSIAVKSGQWQYPLGTSKPLNAQVLATGSLWLGLQFGTDPELQRKPVGSAIYAIRAAVADGLECSGCIGAGQVDNKLLAGYAKTADLAKVALSGQFSDLNGGPDLSAYAKLADLSAYAKTADLANYAKASTLAKVATSGSYKDLADTPKLADVAMTGAYGDLLNKPTVPKVGAACGSGLAMIGIKADGSYDCAATPILPDMIKDVSNKLIWDTFIDSQAGTADVAIPDGLGAGKTDSLDFPDYGVAQAVWVDVNVVNSDISKMKIELFGPGMATPYVLYDGTQAGMSLVTSFNKDTPAAGGQMNKDWIGKNIKGTWSITVKDTLKNQISSTTDGKYNWAINVQTLSDKKIQVKGNLIVDGTLSVGGSLPWKRNYVHTTVTGPHTSNSGGGWAQLDSALTVTLAKATDASTVRIDLMTGALEANSSWGWGHIEVRMDGAVIQKPWGCSSEMYSNSDGVRPDTLSCLATNIPKGNHVFTVWWTHLILEDIGLAASDGRQSAHATLLVEEIP